MVHLGGPEACNASPGSIALAVTALRTGATAKLPRRVPLAAQSVSYIMYHVEVLRTSFSLVLVFWHFSCLKIMAFVVDLVGKVYSTQFEAVY